MTTIYIIITQKEIKGSYSFFFSNTTCKLEKLLSIKQFGSSSIIKDNTDIYKKNKDSRDIEGLK